MSKQPLRVLVVDDVPNDAELMILQLRRDGFEPDWQRVDEEGAFLDCLVVPPEIILADYTLPKFSGQRALEVLRERALDIPLILVSGTIGEEVAVEAIRLGAYDYVLKDKLTRLAPSVRNALKEKRLREEASAAERALRDSEVRFRKLIENAPDAFSLLGSDGKLKYASPSTMRLLGYSPEEILGADPAEATHPDDLPRLLAQLAELIQNPELVITTQYRYRHKDGTWRWLESTITNQLAEPSVQAIVFNYRDFTERQRAEEEQRRAEEKYRTLVEQLPAITYVDILDEAIERGEFRTSYLSPQVEALLGYRPDDFYADATLWVKLIHPDDRAQVMAAHAAHYSSKAPYHGEYRMVRRDGSELWVRDESVIVSGEGDTLLIQGVVVDITQSRDFEAALTQSEARKAAILESAQDCIITIDHQGRVIEFNPAAVATFGYSRSQAVGRELAELIIPSTQRARHRTGLQRFLETGHGAIIGKRLELVALRADGSEFPVELTVTHMTAGGMPIFIGFVRDITERKRAEEALAREQHLMRSLMDNIPDAVYFKDLESRFIRVNKGTAAKHGLSDPEAMIGKTDFDYFEADSAGRMFADERKIIETGEPNIGAEEEEVWPDRPPTWASSSKLPFLNEAGEITGTFGVSRDITERKRHQSELETITAVSAAMRKAATRAEMLPIILDQLIGLLRVEAAALAMRDPNTNETVIELALGAWSAGTGRRLPAGEGISGEVIATGIPYLTNEVSTDPRYIAPISGSQLSAAACVPLKAQEQTIGALWIARSSPIDAGEVQLLTAISNIAASAIQRATLFETTQRRLKQISALHSIDIAISSSFDLRFTLNILLEQVSSHLGVDATDVLLLNQHTQMLEYVAGRGFMSVGLERLRLRLGEGSAGKAALERRLVSVPNLREDEGRMARRELLATERFVSYYGVPLIAKGQIKGVLEIFQRSPLNPDPDWLSFLETLAEQAAIAINDATMFDSLQRSNTELVLAYDATIEGWSRALDLRDNETEGHTQRVAAMTLRLARSMSLSEADLIQMRRGALLHDIGKMGIPDSILLKPDKLSDDEWVVMRKHPVYAYELMRPIEFLRPAVDIPYAHHEKWDGTGYPRGLDGDHIPLAARIFMLADVWDALRSDRPYRKAWPAEQARDYILSQAGKHFDPAMVDTFLRMESVEA